jgi:hypothetical protein
MSVSLREFFQAIVSALAARMDARDKTIDDKFDNLLREKVEAAKNIDKRLDTLNEIRGILEDKQEQGFTRAEHESFAKAIESDIRVLREFRAELNGKASQAQMNITFLVSFVGLVCGLFSLALNAMRK